MAVVAMTKEMGSLGTTIGIEVARRLGYEYLRNDLIAAVAREYRVREASVVGAVEERPRLLDRLSRRGLRYRACLEAAVLDAALRDRVVLGGRWSTVFLRGVAHAVRVRVCAPVPVRVRRVSERLGVGEDEALRRLRAYDEGVRARIRQVFDVDWTDPLLYDLVVNTEAVTVESAARQVVTLAEAPEFQPTAGSRAALADRALAARVRATLRSSPSTGALDVDAAAAGGRVRLTGVVGSEGEAAAAAAVAREVAGVVEVTSETKVFRRPVR